MDKFLQKLSAALARLSAGHGAAGLAVAYSGGLDSSVLLAALVRLGPERGIRALHVNHGLHADSTRWERHCRETADAMGVDFRRARIHVDIDNGQSLEAAARTARYRALEKLLTPGELLLTAHNREDQLETVLMRLLRGSGVKGLRGIAEFKPLGAHYVARPLLQMSRREIGDVARAWGLSWLEDPSNQDTRFDRNYLRAEVLPRLLQRWPGAGATAGRAARQLADAQAILDGVARADAGTIQDPARISRAQLLTLSPPRQRNLLRHFIARAGLPTPTAGQLEALRAGIAVDRPDAQTRVQWPGGEGRIHRGNLHLLESLGPDAGPGYRGRVRSGEPWWGREGRVELIPSQAQGLPDTWAKVGLTVRFRAGGERFKPLDAGHHRPLKKWLQEAGIVPWMRGRIPLLYREGTLVSVGDLWVSDGVGERSDGEPAWRVCWTNHPPLT